MSHLSLRIVSLFMYVQQIIATRDSAAAKFFFTPHNGEFTLLPLSTHRNAVHRCRLISGTILHVHDDDFLKVVRQLLSFTDIVDLWIGASNVTHNCCSSKKFKIDVKKEHTDECFNLFATRRQIQVIFDDCEERKKAVCRIDSDERSLLSVLCVGLGVICFVLSFLLAFRIHNRCVSSDTKSTDVSFNSTWNT